MDMTVSTIPNAQFVITANFSRNGGRNTMQETNSNSTDRASNLCSDCGIESGKFRRCFTHRQQNAEHQRRWYSRHIDTARPKKVARVYAKRGLEASCK
jgi:hypothetical protein